MGACPHEHGPARVLLRPVLGLSSRSYGTGARGRKHPGRPGLGFTVQAAPAHCTWNLEIVHPDRPGGSPAAGPGSA